MTLRRASLAVCVLLPPLAATAAQMKPGKLADDRDREHDDRIGFRYRGDEVQDAESGDDAAVQR
jgi:hypothetical protein